MPLSDDIEEFRRNVAKAIEELEEVRNISDRLGELTVDDIRHNLSKLEVLCEEISVKIKQARDQLTEINNQWGSVPFKTFSNTENNYKNSDLENSLNRINSFFVSSIQVGLPIGLVLDSIGLVLDFDILRNLITSQSALSGTASQEDQKAALQSLSRTWKTIALGDQGELSTLKALLDSGISPESIVIKPSLTNRLGEKACPDFYCKSERLICDAKAWKGIYSINNLQEVVNKYAACLEDGGEVRLYFPSDTYTSHINILNQLSSPSPSIKVTVYPMPETHKELEWRKELFYHYIKSCKEKSGK